MRKITTIGLLALACVVNAQQPLKFIERPGVLEFTGEMIVRPAQMDALMNKGYSVANAAVLQNAARARVQRFAKAYFPETDEFVVKIPQGFDENSYSQALMATGSYEYVEPNWLCYPTVVPNDPQVGNQWHIAKTQAYQGWDLFRGDTESIIVAITDTGVRTTHQDLVARMVPGANTANGSSAIPQASGGQVNDINGHGTHCAGIAAASGNNGLGVSGMGWANKIMPIRVTNSSGGSASLSSLTLAARWAADNGAHVVSTSYSGVTSSSVQTTGAYLRSKNVNYFWAAGNNGANLGSAYDWPDVNIIGNSTSNDTRNSSSAYGIAIDFFAPGTNILATGNGSNSSYISLTGTSMACPLAAGSAAVVKGSNPNLTSYQVETSLYMGCDDIGPAGEDNTFGHGRVNLNKALRYAYNNYPFLAGSFNAVRGTASGSLSNLNNSDNNYVTLNGTGSVEVKIVVPTTLLAVGTTQLILESGLTGGGQATLTVIAETPSGNISIDGGLVGLESTKTITLPNSVVNQSTKTATFRLQYRNYYRNSNIIAAPRPITVNLDRAVLFTKPN